MTVDVNNTEHRATVQYSVENPGSWNSFGCHPIQTICPKPLADQTMTMTPTHLYDICCPSRTECAATAQNCTMIMTKSFKVSPNSPDPNLTEPWIPSGRAVAMKGFTLSEMMFG